MTRWTDNAACLGMDVEAFFPNPSDTDAVDRAQAVCARCPVRLDCLDAELEREGGVKEENRYGIRGGMNEKQRRNEYKRRAQVRARRVRGQA